MKLFNPNDGPKVKELRELLNKIELQTRDISMYLDRVNNLVNLDEDMIEDNFHGLYYALTELDSVRISLKKATEYKDHK